MLPPAVCWFCAEPNPATPPAFWKPCVDAGEKEKPPGDFPAFPNIDGVLAAPNSPGLLAAGVLKVDGDEKLNPAPLDPAPNAGCDAAPPNPVEVFCDPNNPPPVGAADAKGEDAAALDAPPNEKLGELVFPPNENAIIVYGIFL